METNSPGLMFEIDAPEQERFSGAGFDRLFEIADGDHSDLNAMTGSTRLARRAGSQTANERHETQKYRNADEHTGIARLHPIQEARDDPRQR